MGEVGIYKITNNINKKFYIGSTNNCNRRHKEHFSDLRKNKHYNHKLQFAFNKYGEINFSFDILEYVNNVDLLIEREQFYLNTLLYANSDKEKFKLLGYNLNYMAERGGSYEFTKEMLLKKSERLKGDKNHMFGVKMSEEIKKQISNTLTDKFSGKNSFNYKGGYVKPKNKLESNTIISLKNNYNVEKTRQSEKSGNIVLQYDSNMNLINQWTSIKKASDTLNISRASIKRCCDGKDRHAGFFIWRLKGKEDVDYEFRCNPIIQLNENNEVIAEYNQIVIAAETLKINRKYISKALRNGNTYCGFYWKYKNQLQNNIDSII